MKKSAFLLAFIGFTLLACGSKNNNNQALLKKVEQAPMEMKEEQKKQSPSAKESKEGIPTDLKIIEHIPYRGMIFKSGSGRMFASIYYEEGHYQGDVIFELTPEEKQAYQKDSDVFLKAYSDKVNQSFKSFKEERHLDDFRKTVDTGKLVSEWKESN